MPPFISEINLKCLCWFDCQLVYFIVWFHGSFPSRTRSSSWWNIKVKVPMAARWFPCLA